MSSSTETVWVQGPIIVGSGPSGIAVAACLSRQGIPSIVLEKSASIASLWKDRTYDRLKLHLPKHFCNLPFLPFPNHFPKYPSKRQFVSYVESYADHFHVSPIFRQPVLSAAFDSASGIWTVVTPDHRFVSRWLVAATGENADPFRPEIPGLDRFSGKVVHTSGYKSGDEFRGQKVLVVGCGNSGMEVSLDLCRNNALPHMVVRNSVHVLPREVMGFSTFGIAMALLKWLPMKLVDKVLLLAASLTLGNTDQLGLKRPKTGPMELKNATGKTPVLDVGAFSLIKAGKIKIMEGVKEVTRNGAKFVDGQEREFDSIVLATGYKSNVPTWLQGCDFFNKDDGMPRTPFPDGWKGDNGLYTVGFTRRGLLGTSSDAVKIAEDIAQQWRIVNEECKTFSSPDSHIILLNKP